MCYDISQLLRSQLKRARLFQDEASIADLLSELRKRGLTEWHHVSGFSHPELVIYTQEEPHNPQLAKWGLIPVHTHSLQDAHELWNKTINARIETLWEKPSFKNSAQHRRCLIPAEGFFEHHHIAGGSYPHFITLKSGYCFHLAGIWSEWRDPVSGEFFKTCALVTTKANAFMATIHNNPKVDGPRMPAILREGAEEMWLHGNDKDEVSQLLEHRGGLLLRSTTVRKIRGKDASANSEEATAPFRYPEMGLF